MPGSPKGVCEGEDAHFNYTETSLWSPEHGAAPSKLMASQAVITDTPARKREVIIPPASVRLEPLLTCSFAHSFNKHLLSAC